MTHLDRRDGRAYTVLQRNGRPSSNEAPRAE